MKLAFVKNLENHAMQPLRILALAIVLITFSRPVQAQSYAVGQSDSPTSPVTPAGESSPWGWLPKPKITMPKVTMPKIEMPKLGMSSLADGPFAPVKASAGKVVAGTKKAWEGTKEIFTFGNKGDGQSPRVASKEQPSAWSQMFGARQEPEPPRTIGEFMQGERLK